MDMLRKRLSDWLRWSWDKGYAKSALIGAIGMLGAIIYSNC